MRQFTLSIVLSAVLLIGGSVLSGCGGAGTLGTTSSLNTPQLPQTQSIGKAAPTPAGNAVGKQTGIFLTTSKNGGWGDGYDRVFVTLHKVELLDKESGDKSDAFGATTVLFDDAEGRTFDLKTLHDASGARTVLLAAVPVPPIKQYTRIRVILGKTLLVFPSGATKSENLPFADTVARDSENRRVLTMALERPRSFGETENLLADFDLSAFAKENGGIVPTIREGKSEILADVARQEPTEITGTISDLSGAGEARSLLASDDKGGRIAVQFDKNTVSYSADASDGGLADKRRARIVGVCDPVSRRLIAQTVETSDAAKSSTTEVTIAGSTSRAKENNHTFAIVPQRTRGLLPTQSAITVTLADNAPLRSRGGLRLSAEDFFAGLQSRENRAEVIGNYDAALGTFTATEARLDGKPASGTREAAVSGNLTTTETADTLALTGATDWEGLLATPANTKSVPVTLTDATTFRDEKGGFISKATFKQRLSGRSVHIVGLYGTKGGFTATRITLNGGTVASAPVENQEKGK